MILDVIEYLENNGPSMDFHELAENCGYLLTNIDELEPDSIYSFHVEIERLIGEELILISPNNLVILL